MQRWDPTCPMQPPSLCVIRKYTMAFDSPICTIAQDNYDLIMKQMDESTCTSEVVVYTICLITAHMLKIETHSDRDREKAPTEIYDYITTLGGWWY